ncbi:MAG TPA: hypothetical protein ENI35_00590 [Candidatus Desulfofervidus auxilii]|uniref:Uncharacterized protein n=1 Tax=Desulfofervidus auxilii TaxID=1621989 RepID=A0A7C1VW36_DESA2|nr:hypothetical protein [Candidatus Desulfofervidus auxilii]
MKKMKCHNCGKPAIVTYNNGKLALCLDCNLKFQQAQELIFRRNVKMLNYLTAEIEAVGGLPRLFPRYKVSSPVYYKGDLVLNNINIQNSNVGVINTGNVESIDVSLTFLKEQGNEEIAELIKILTKEIIKNKDIVENQKNEILEQLAFITEQLSIPKEQRKTSILKTIFATIFTSISGFSNLLEILKKVKKLIF